MSPDLLSRDGRKAQRHERAVVGCVGLDNAYVSHAFSFELTGERLDRCLIRHRQHHRKGALCKTPRTALARGVNEVRCLNSSREVRPNDHVVGQDGDRREREGLGISRCSVAGRT